MNEPVRFITRNQQDHQAEQMEALRRDIFSGAAFSGPEWQVSKQCLHLGPLPDCPCIKPKGHDGAHEDRSGCRWENL